jgi:hypothetical protein
MLEAESIPDHSAAGWIRSIEKSNELIGNRTRGLPAFNIVLQSTTLPRAPSGSILHCNFSVVSKSWAALGHPVFLSGILQLNKTEQTDQNGVAQK